MCIYLQKKTKKLAHRYFRQFQLDPALFSDIQQYHPYEYCEAECDKMLERYERMGRIYLAIMMGDEPIGEIVLKQISLEKKHCTLGITMRSDEFKNKGYGTQAELLALDHAFRIMDLEIVYADSLLNNTRSQHVLKKVGFKEIRRDESFVYYECRKQDRIDPAA